MSRNAAFFARDPFPPGVPYLEPAEVEAECRFLSTGRAIALRCLQQDAEAWLECAEFREFCALLGVDTDPASPGPQLPAVPAGWRWMAPGETIGPRDQWRPLRRRPSQKHDLRLPFEAVQPALHGLTLEAVHARGIRAQFIRPLACDPPPA